MYPSFNAGHAAPRASPPAPGRRAGLAAPAAPRGCSLGWGDLGLCALKQLDRVTLREKVAQPAPGVLSICFARF